MELHPTLIFQAKHLPQCSNVYQKWTDEILHFGYHCDTSAQVGLFPKHHEVLNRDSRGTVAQTGGKVR